MSVNYASGLSDYPQKGKCGQPEVLDSQEDFNIKLNLLVDWIRSCKYCVVLTGAGISTSAGIPDFRGPSGVWTLEERGISPSFTTTFDEARASLGHMALVALENAGWLKYLITQNVDGLHIRSGFPRDRMSILHGDMFTETCDRCGHQFIMKRSVKTMGLKYTGNKCNRISQRGSSCRGRLKDTILDWEDALPDRELDSAVEQCKRADLVLVLGSSLQIVPAGNLPLLTKKAGGRFVTVNLQKTKHHSKSDLVIHERIDRVLERICLELGVPIASYTKPTVVFHSSHTELKTISTNASLAGWNDDCSKEDNSRISLIVDSSLLPVNVNTHNLKRANTDKLE